MSQDVNIKELNERIKKESEFVDLITLEIQKVIVGQKNLVERLLIGLLSGQSVRLTVPEENFRKEPAATAGNRLATVLEGAVMGLVGKQGRWDQVTLEGWIWRPSTRPSTMRTWSHWSGTSRNLPIFKRFSLPWAGRRTS